MFGGVYRELCLEPEIDQIFGSGFRAAFAISGAARALKLVTSADTESEAHVRKFADAFSFDVDIRSRPHQIQYQYDTPLSSPRCVNEDMAYRESIEVESDVVLAFGTVDSKANIQAKQLVIDPQGLSDLNQLGKWTADRLAIVGNRSEVIALAGGVGDVTTCAYRVLERYSAEIVVVKNGALGALVVDSEGVSAVGAYPTPLVKPIGSGDVFSGVFAYAWAEQGATAVNSARFASQATAAYVSKGPFQVLTSSGALAAGDIGAEASVKPVCVYLAGPFFSLGQRWLVNLCKTGLLDLGAEAFSPLHDVGFGPPEVVAPADLQGLNVSNSMLALLDGCDSGTLYEVGYAAAKGIPVVGFSSSMGKSDLTMVAGTEVPIYDDFSSAVYNSIWLGLR